jgi:hypothetical protein
VPEFVPGPNSSMRWSGHSGRRSFQVLACLEALAVQMRLSSDTLRLSTKVFCLLTTTARPSMATWISKGVMPLAWQALVSLERMGRLASATSISPRQNFWRPPPVPEKATLATMPAQ